MVWTAYSRREKRVIAFTFGEGLPAAKEIYLRVKELRQNIEVIYTDANSCYKQAFKQLQIPERHVETKAQTHLIESSNSSIRDRLGRFNRKTKRYTKSMEMLEISLILHFNRKLLFKSPSTC